MAARRPSEGLESGNCQIVSIVSPEGARRVMATMTKTEGLGK
jgi:hypothetical protein